MDKTDKRRTEGEQRLFKLSNNTDEYALASSYACTTSPDLDSISRTFSSTLRAGEGGRPSARTGGAAAVAGKPPPYTEKVSASDFPMSLVVVAVVTAAADVPGSGDAGVGAGEGEPPRTADAVVCGLPGEGDRAEVTSDTPVVVGLPPGAADIARAAVDPLIRSMADNSWLRLLSFFCLALLASLPSSSCLLREACSFSRSFSLVFCIEANLPATLAMPASLAIAGAVEDDAMVRLRTST
jgi:hypothetical protein